MEKKIAVIRGDGIGPEIMTQALAVLDAVAEKFGHTFRYAEAPMGGNAIDAFGVPLPDASLQTCLESDAALLSAVGGPKWDTIDPAIRPEKGLLALRSGLMGREQVTFRGRAIHYRRVLNAMTLALVVLFTLANTNVSERIREMATLKVLGFYDKEVYRYIFREIELLSLIGSGVGLLLGVPLHRFIVLTVEMDQLMFIRTIAPHSYLLAVALTMLFTFVVCFAMRRHVRHISMVESMKAPE